MILPLHSSLPLKEDTYTGSLQEKAHECLLLQSSIKVNKDCRVVESQGDTPAGI
jgi:hypothetical protein